MEYSTSFAYNPHQNQLDLADSTCQIQNTQNFQQTPYNTSLPTYEGSSQATPLFPHFHKCITKPSQYPLKKPYISFPPFFATKHTIHTRSCSLSHHPPQNTQQNIFHIHAQGHFLTHNYMLTHSNPPCQYQQ